MNPRVCLITCTAGRHYCLERVVRFFLDQAYPNAIQLIFQNSTTPQRLNSNIDESRVKLVNQPLDSRTGNRYTNVGAIFRDAFAHVPAGTDIVSFFDDDDIFLPNHITEGIRGLVRGGKKAYKPFYSFFRTGGKVSRVNNTLEPSIFVHKGIIDQYGFKEETVDYHGDWVLALRDREEIFVDKEGPSTMCYNWGDNFFTFKTSGDPHNPANFSNYHAHSKDHGDGIVTPISQKEADKYYQLFNNENT